MKTNKLLSSLIWLLIFGVVTLTLNACPKKQTVKKTPDQEEAKAEDSDEVATEELDIHGKNFVESKNLALVHFDYDSSELSNEAREILAENAEYLKKNNNLEVLVEGHCDERGTIAYNLALGQKRAASIIRYYISLGIPPKEVGSLSYGKEKPICMENTEECWATNRRAETKIRTLKVVNGKEKEGTNKLEATP